MSGIRNKSVVIHRLKRIFSFVVLLEGKPERLVFFWLHQNHSVTIADVTQQLKYMENRLDVTVDTDLWSELNLLERKPDWRTIRKKDLESLAYWMEDVAELIERELNRIGVFGNRYEND